MKSGCWAKSQRNNSTQAGLCQALIFPSPSCITAGRRPPTPNPQRCGVLTRARADTHTSVSPLWRMQRNADPCSSPPFTPSLPPFLLCTAQIAVPGSHPRNEGHVGFWTGLCTDANTITSPPSFSHTHTSFLSPITHHAFLKRTVPSLHQPSLGPCYGASMPLWDPHPSCCW